MDNESELAKATDEELQYMLADDLTLPASDILAEIDKRKS